MLRFRRYFRVAANLLTVLEIIGISAGAHRLWSHRAYKATWQLRTILILFYSICMQKSAYWWALIHRLHHRHVDTDADPVNSNQGFMFSQLIWITKFPRPEVYEQSKKIYMSDLHEDKIVMFQHKYVRNTY